MIAFFFQEKAGIHFLSFNLPNLAINRITKVNISRFIADYARQNPAWAVMVGFLIYFSCQAILFPAYLFILSLGFGMPYDGLLAVIRGEFAGVENPELIIRLVQGGNQVLGWGLAGFVGVSMLGNRWEVAGFTSKVSVGQLVLASLLIFAVLPIAQLTSFNPDTFHLPEGMSSLENALRDTESRSWAVFYKVLGNTQTGALLSNILIFAITPALMEELFFRGFMQRALGRNWNPHVAIWVTAFVFSLMHFQVYAFFPRMMLGAMLGYFLWISGSLWTSVIGHFCYNLFNILMVYVVVKYQVVDPDVLRTGGEMPEWWGLASLLAVGILFFVYLRLSKHKITS